jgi:hypothetical protein
MLKRKPLLFFTLVIAIVALFAVSAVKASDDPEFCNTTGKYLFTAQDPYPQYFTGTLTHSELGDLVCPVADCWLWYIKVTSSPAREINNLTQVSFRFQEPEVGQGSVQILDSNSSVNPVTPCSGASQDWLKGVCDGDQYTLNAQGTVLDNQYRLWLVTSQGGEGNGALAAIDSKGAYVCPDGFKLPVPGLPSFVTTQPVIRMKIKGRDVCVDVDTSTGCPPVDNPHIYECDTGLVISEDPAFKLGDPNSPHPFLDCRSPGLSNCPICAVTGNDCTWVTLFGVPYGPFWPPCE